MFNLPDFENFIDSLDVNKLRDFQCAIQRVIANKLSPNNSQSEQFYGVSPPKCVTPINELIDYHENFIDSKEHEFLAA